MRIASLFIAVPAMFCATSAQAAITFDEPIKIEKVALKADKLNPQAKAELSCLTYKGFGIKQVDRGEVGAERLSIIKLADGKALTCSEAKQKREYVIPERQWSGYFLGAKANYAFFSAPDGTNGGQGFAVFDTRTNAKLLEDLAQNGIAEAVMNDNVFTLNYQRVYAADCSVITGGQACAAYIARATGVNANSTLCAEGYAKGKQAMARGRCEAQSDKADTCFAKEMRIIEEQKWDSAPTVVVYNAQAVIGRASAVVTALGDALACRPSD